MYNANNTGTKIVEDNSVTNILLMNKENCALKLADEIILYYDARTKKQRKLCIKVGWWNNSVLWCTVEETSNYKHMCLKRVNMDCLILRNH